MSADGACGWHGKLPAVGDFATRRLPHGFVEAWDGWLSAGLAGLQQHAGWLDAYLASPSWRFLLAPGVLPGPLGETHWVGVLMPSVDRVGRYYPLTLAQPLATLPAGEAGIDRLWSWMLQLDEAAADALHEDWPIDRLEAELARLGPAPAGTHGASPQSAADAAVVELPLSGWRHAGERFAAEARTAWSALAHGHAFWFSQSDIDAPHLLRTSGLAPAAVARLLGGAACPSPVSPPTSP